MGNKRRRELVFGAIVAALIMALSTPWFANYHKCRAGQATLQTPTYCRCVAVKGYATPQIGSRQDRSDLYRRAALACAADQIESLSPN
jgi:hypothetical protein